MMKHSYIISVTLLARQWRKCVANIYDAAGLFYVVLANFAIWSSEQP